MSTVQPGGDARPRDARRAAATGELKETERVVQGPGPGRGPFGGGMIGQKAMDFRSSSRRLLATMRPQRPSWWRSWCWRSCRWP